MVLLSAQVDNSSLRTALSDLLIQAFPEMNQDEQWLALTLYRLLAEGRSVAIEQLAGIIEQPEASVKHTLRNWPGVFFDADDKVIGFWGISVVEMPHRLTVNATTVFCWCAWDTLFIPELLQARARVSSSCPITKHIIELEVSSDRVKTLSEHDVVVSFLKPDIADLKKDITASFCHFVYFFSGQGAGEQWCVEHPGSFLLSLDDAFIVGKAMNTARYQILRTT